MTGLVFFVVYQHVNFKIVSIWKQFNVTLILIDPFVFVAIQLTQNNSNSRNVSFSADFVCQVFNLTIYIHFELDTQFRVLF